MIPLWSIPAVAVVLWIAWLSERRYPAEPNLEPANVVMDWKLAAIRIGMGQLTSPLMSISGVLIINAAGGGWCELRSDGWWSLLSVIVLILTTDLLSYLLHRASHRFPILWAMHSLHHNAESLSIITGARHYWLEDVTNAAAFWVVGIVFKIPSELTTFVTLTYLLPCALTHMNVRLSLGPLALVINNPQYHRIHHSIEPQHWDKNFCRMFPLFDIIFGTAWRPGKDEFPMTGLVPREKATALDGLIWPIRHKIPVLAHYATTDE
jgi:sterol desaturase/sphingolipid hydroxylase (fatty acid hydroxylase superfamily)